MKIFILIALLPFITLQSREDCVGIHFKDKHGVRRTNTKQDLTFDGYGECLCSCNGQWTKAGKCITCRHYKKRSPKHKYKF